MRKEGGDCSVHCPPPAQLLKKTHWNYCYDTKLLLLLLLLLLVLVILVLLLLIVLLLLLLLLLLLQLLQQLQTSRYNKFSCEAQCDRLSVTGSDKTVVCGRGSWR
jgi:H+/Cl- antiporter ClcA